MLFSFIIMEFIHYSTNYTGDNQLSNLTTAPLYHSKAGSRREQPSEQLDADIDALTAQLRPLRRELRLCGKIAEYAPRMLRQVQESTSPSTENHLPNKAKERRHSLWR